MKKLVLDFETRSACELKKAGAYKYSLDPTTRPTCLAFKERGGTVQLMKYHQINKAWVEQPVWFRRFWRESISNGYLFCAHNAGFEICIYKNILVARYGWPDIPFRQWRCTAAKAAICALPRSLEGAGAALNLSVQKDREGYAAMMATCKPTKRWNAWKKARAAIAEGRKVAAKTRAIAEAPEPPQFLEYEADPETWNVLYKYCRIDVEAEEAVDEALPDLSDAEQEIWFLNQRINWRGLRVDVPTIKKIVGIMEVESKIKLKELDTVTMGLVTKPGARKSILEFLALEGIELPDIRAKTVDDMLGSFRLSDDARKLLEIRKALSKTSTKKYQSFLDRVCGDGYVRDILMYAGAHTARDTGTGVQPHNFPRGVIRMDKARPYATVETIMKCDYEMLKLLDGDSLAMVFSSVLRNMILPDEGEQLFVADFSKIEVAILWWFADNWPGLNILKAGKDPYKYQAAANLGKTYDEIPDEGDARQLGKAQTLGCGFRMSWKRFRDTAWEQYRLKLTNKQSVEAVRSYREANKAVVELWNTYEDAAIETIETGRTVRANKCVFSKSRGFLWIRLPSGRSLAYLSPRIVWSQLTYDVLEVDEETGEETIVSKTGKPRKTIEFMAMDKSKKNMVIERTHGGVITENIVQSFARELMKNGEKELEAARYKVKLSVHDELLTSKKTGSVEEMTKLMCTRPGYIDDNLPLEAVGWVGPRYKK